MATSGSAWRRRETSEALPDLEPGRLSRRLRCMPHASNRPAPTFGFPTPSPVPCVRCSRPVPVTRAGRVKTGTRYCSARCRTSDVRDHRAEARMDLLEALVELRAVEVRVEEALAVLGLNPALDRRKR